MRECTGMYVDDFIFDSPGSEVTHYDLLQEMWAPVYGELSDEQIDGMLAEVLSGMSLEEVEGFWGTLGTVFS